MKSVMIIPARYGSSRLPGKPLALVAGTSLLERVWRIASAVKNVDEVLVATDDERISKHADSFGARSVLTPPACRNGTERVHAAIASLDVTPQIVINLQGDAVLTPPWVIQGVVDTLLSNPSIDIATPAVALDTESYEKLREAKAGGEVGGTTVVFDREYRALYFSKSLIPFRRDGADIPVYRHIGLYGYRTEALARYIELPETPLEKAEQIECLRALEFGMKISVVPVDYRGRSHCSVDSESDIGRAEELIAREGELL